MVDLEKMAAFVNPQMKAPAVKLMLRRLQINALSVLENLIVERQVLNCKSARALSEASL